jgi:hypothetical protein
MKFTVRFFTFLLIILLSGYGQALANSPKESAAHSQVENSEELKSINLSDLLIGHNVKVTPYGLDIRNINDKIYSPTNDNEENELTSSKKNISLGSYLTPYFHFQTLGHLNTSIKRRLLFSKHFYYTPSNRRFILFRVIRI